MLYTSTRDTAVRATAAEAIVRGISADGGLFVPLGIPKLSLKDIERLCPLSYAGRAGEILKLYLTDFTKEELSGCVGGAYSSGKFSSERIAPLRKLGGGTYMLELWRGPTCAFKDMALQLLPYLLTAAAHRTLKGTGIVILVATSGDTGKAALEGFRDVPGTEIAVFYPENGVSPMQKLQMTAQEGGNVHVCAVEGNFDDAQNGVKAIFADRAIKSELSERGLALSSANSINWGRLVPQLVYYISAYCELLSENALRPGEKLNAVVPTGNFGNILAAFYAKEMGVPIAKLICASNANNVLTDFLKTGEYNRNRPFYRTSSPSMDILISSNLERLLFHLSKDADEVRAYMSALGKEGRYRVSDGLFAKISGLFEAGFCDDERTARTIREAYEKYGCLCDPHTAVALNVYEDYVSRTGDSTPSVIASTANPYKFPACVLSALSGKERAGDGFALMRELHALTGEPIPQSLAELECKKVRFDRVCAKGEMAPALFGMLGM